MQSVLAQNPRIQCIVASAAVMFTDDIEKEVLEDAASFFAAKGEFAAPEVINLACRRSCSCRFEFNATAVLRDCDSATSISDSSFDRSVGCDPVAMAISTTRPCLQILLRSRCCDVFEIAMLWRLPFAAAMFVASAIVNLVALGKPRPSVFLSTSMRPRTSEYVFLSPTTVGPSGATSPLSTAAFSPRVRTIPPSA